MPFCSLRLADTTTSLAALACAALCACGQGQAAPEPNRPAAPTSLPEVARAPEPAPSAAAAEPDATEPAASAAPAPPEPAPAGMARVPAGSFTMGADEGGEPDERPAHTVTLPAFYLDLTEVTQAAYQACVDAGACTPAKAQFLTSFGGAFAGPNKPIVGVSQAQAAKFCEHLGKRLPSEAEFERAVRGDDGRTHPWGNEPPNRERAVYSTAHTDDVGSRPAGRGPFGHDDLAGNAWEWMADLYDPAAYTRDGASAGQPGSCEQILAFQDELRRTGQQGFTGSNPIPTRCEHNIRGGAYNMPAKALRATNRVHHPGTWQLQMTGMRCAKDAE